MTDVQGKTEKVLIFLHLAKTGGTTFESILYKVFRPSSIIDINEPRGAKLLQEMDGDKSLPIRCIVGNKFGIDRSISELSFYITFLRDPVERVISDYFHVLRVPEHHAHVPVTHGNMSIVEYVESFPEDTKNLQTKLIAGVDVDDAEALDLAKRNIRENILVAGITEEFDESLAVIQRTLGWKSYSYVWGNVTKRRPKKEEIGEDIVDIIEKANALDRQLYEFTRKVLHDRIDHQRSEGSDGLKMETGKEEVMIERDRVERKIALLQQIHTRVPEVGDVVLYGNQKDEELCINYLRTTCEKAKVYDWLDCGAQGLQTGLRWGIMLPIQRIVSVPAVLTALLSSKMKTKLELEDKVVIWGQDEYGLMLIMKEYLEKTRGVGVVGVVDRLDSGQIPREIADFIVGSDRKCIVPSVVVRSWIKKEGVLRFGVISRADIGAGDWIVIDSGRKEEWDEVCLRYLDKVLGVEIVYVGKDLEPAKRGENARRVVIEYGRKYWGTKEVVSGLMSDELQVRLSKDDRIFIYGTGQKGIACRKTIERRYPGTSILGWIDTDVKKTGATIDGLSVHTLEDALSKGNDKIIIASMYWMDIISHIVRRGHKIERGQFQVWP